MIRKIKIIFLVVLGFNCNNKVVSKISDIDLVKQAIVAIEKYDTLKLYDVVDTAHCFKLYSKENFENKIATLNSAMKRLNWNKDSVKVSDFDRHYKKYSCPFRNVANNNKDLVAYFIVAANNVGNKIFYFDLETNIPIQLEEQSIEQLKEIR